MGSLSFKHDMRSETGSLQHVLGEQGEAGGFLGQGVSQESLGEATEEPRWLRQVEDTLGMKIQSIESKES